LISLLLAVSFSFSRAEENNADIGYEKMAHSSMMEMKKNKFKEMHSMGRDRSLVATQDGGVVVLAGNKLLKYNQDLVLQKEVEIKSDMEGMRKKFMEKCPMKNRNMELEDSEKEVSGEEEE